VGSLLSTRLLRALPASLCVLLFAGVIEGACTFYTGPPPPANNNNNSSAGAASDTSGAGAQNGGGANADAGSGPGAAGANDEAGTVEPDPTGVWVNVTGSLATLAKGGGDLSTISPVPNSKRLIAGIGTKGLWATDDNEKTWTQLGTAGPQIINNDPTAIIYDPDHPEVFWESGIYGDGAFRTDDAGQTFKLLGNAAHCDLISVDFTDSARQTILRGAHETRNVLWLSKDGGSNWTDIGGKLPSNSSFSTLPLIIDTKTFLVGSCGNTQQPCGLFRSTNGGTTWTTASTDGPVARPLWASDGTIYWSLYGGGMITSTDNGKTWNHTSDGPVPTFYSASPVELPDRRIVTLSQGFPIATADQGKTWKKIGGPLPFPGQNCGTYSIAYSATTNAFFLNHNDCSGHISSDALWRLPFDYKTE
jgi:photosystem II stability/assembly factor-like uncharacterized protein